jgi:hypothetical protein
LSLSLLSKDGAYPCRADIRQGWKCLEVTNTTAYCAKILTTVVKVITVKSAYSQSFHEYDLKKFLKQWDINFIWRNLFDEKIFKIILFERMFCEYDFSLKSNVTKKLQ